MLRERTDRRRIIILTLKLKFYFLFGISNSLFNLRSDDHGDYHFDQIGRNKYGSVIIRTEKDEERRQLVHRIIFSG